MRIKVKVHPNSSKEKIVKINEEELGVWVKEKPIDNKANEKLIKVLKNYFKRQVKLISGLKSRNKTFEIIEK